MDSRTKLDKALANITLDRNLAFWAGLSVQVPKVLTDEVPTAATDGEKIYINPKYIDTLTVSQTMFLILHELLHIIRTDVVRVGEKDRRVWNIAADVVINDLLKEYAAVDIIKNSVYPEGDLKPLKHQSSEWNYKWLMDNKVDQTSHDELIFNKGIQKDVEAYQNKVKRMVQAAKQAAAKVDYSLNNIPSWLKNLIDSIVEPKIDWRTALKEYIGSMVQQEWTWNRPHTSIFVSTGCIAPSVNDVPTVPNVLILLDSSSSVDDECLLQAWSEIKDMSNNITKLTVAHFTTDIDKVDVYDMQVEVPENIIPKKRYLGGTNIVKVFSTLSKRIENNEIEEPNVIIVLSDMESDMPEKDIGIPTIWGVFKDKEFEAPFGTAIYIK